MNIQPVTAEVASDDRLWHGMASCPCRAGSERSKATVQVYVQGGGGPGPFTGFRPSVQTGSPPQPPYATLPTDRVQGSETPEKNKKNHLEQRGLKLPPVSQEAGFVALPVALFLGFAFVVEFFALGQRQFPLGASAIVEIDAERHGGSALAVGRAVGPRGFSRVRQQCA